MGKRRKKRREAAKQTPLAKSSERSEGWKRSVFDQGKRASARPRTWMETHGRDLRFLLVFGVLMAVYYVATTTSIVKEAFFPWSLDVTTQASAAVLHTLGNDDMQVKGNVLDSPRGWITVGRGCDAMAPTALFISAVAASPAPVLSKLTAVFGGTVILMVVNLLRIITLFWTRIHWPKAFDVMHLDIWQAVFIFLAILLWAFWASWTTQRRRRRSNVPA